MDKLDRLGWAEGLAFSAFGVCVGIRATVSGMLDRILPLLPPGWKKSPRGLVQRLYSLIGANGSEGKGVRHLNLLYANNLRLARETDLQAVLEAFRNDHHLYVAGASPDMTFIHAGVVGWQRRAVVLPGRSFSGKTTLVRELLRLGATYYSDEYALVDERGLIHPFVRPLGIREHGSTVQTDFTPEKLGASVGVEPLRAGTVVITEYQAGTRWEANPLSQGQGALELLANSVAIRRLPEKTLLRLLEVAKRAVFIRGPRGEASEAAASILNLST